MNLIESDIVPVKSLLNSHSRTHSQILVRKPCHAPGMFGLVGHEALFNSRSLIWFQHESWFHEWPGSKPRTDLPSAKRKQVWKKTNVLCSKAVGRTKGPDWPPKELAFSKTTLVLVSLLASLSSRGCAIQIVIPWTDNSTPRFDLVLAIIRQHGVAEIAGHLNMWIWFLLELPKTPRTSENQLKHIPNQSKQMCINECKELKCLKVASRD